MSLIGLPRDIFSEIVIKLHFSDIYNLIQCCKYTSKLWKNESIVKHFLKLLLNRKYKKYIKWFFSTYKFPKTAGIYHKILIVVKKFNTFLQKYNTNSDIISKVLFDYLYIDCNEITPDYSVIENLLALEKSFSDKYFRHAIYNCLLVDMPQMRQKSRIRVGNISNMNNQNASQLSLDSQTAIILPTWFMFIPLKSLTLFGNSEINIRAPPVGAKELIYKASCRSHKYCMCQTPCDKCKNIPTLNINMKLNTAIYRSIRILCAKRIRFEIPPEIAKMANLEHLEVQSCFLESLPKEICNCVHLAQIKLQNNLLSALPEGLVNMPKLKRIVLYDNPIEYFHISWRPISPIIFWSNFNVL